jgi:protein-disulfide isomerase
MPQLPPLSTDDFVRGDLNAPVILVHYGDFECPYSGALHVVLRSLENQFGEKIAVVFRQFPLDDIHPNAMKAALAAQAAGEKFWDMHDLLFENQDDLREGDLLEYAHKIGLDGTQFRIDFTSPQTRETVKESVRAAREIGIHGTPTLFINGQFHDNSEGLWKRPKLLPLIEAALETA